MKGWRARMMQVLVVDDSGTIRQYVRAVVESEGFQAREAADGVEALTVLRAAAEPMVVVLDYQMPKLDGEGVLHAVVEEGAPLSIHEYLVLSANVATFPASFIELLRHLSIRILSKPIEKAVLAAAVTQAAERLNAPPAEPLPWAPDEPSSAQGEGGGAG